MADMIDIPINNSPPPSLSLGNKGTGTVNGIKSNGSAKNRPRLNNSRELPPIDVSTSASSNGGKRRKHKKRTRRNNKKQRKTRKH